MSRIDLLLSGTPLPTVLNPATIMSDVRLSLPNVLGTSAVLWETARTDSWDENSWQPFTDWYVANTGHEALGLSVGDLTPVGGAIESSYDGQVLEGLSGTRIRIRHNNVTVRGCRVTDGATYGMFLSPTYNAPITGAVIEYCTLVRVSEDLTGVNSAYLDPAIGGPLGTSFDVTVRNCNLSGWTQGMRGVNRVNYEYNYFHHSQYPPGVHMNCIRPVGQGGRVYRNMLTEGRSGACSVYFDERQFNDCLIAENILAGIGPNAHPSYLSNLAGGQFAATTYNFVYRDNMFGQNLYGTVAGSPVPWGSNGNSRSGNMYWVDSVSTSSNTFHPQGEMVFND